MISGKRLLKLAQKWQMLAAIRRKRITTQPAAESVETSGCSTSEVAEKGHFVVSSIDQKRFLLPLQYLNNKIIRELFNLAEEEFGLPSKGPLTMTCDAELMEYVISLIKQKATEDVQKALLMSIPSTCSGSFYPQHRETSHQLPFYIF